MGVGVFLYPPILSRWLFPCATGAHSPFLRCDLSESYLPCIFGMPGARRVSGSSVGCSNEGTYPSAGNPELSDVPSLRASVGKVRVDLLRVPPQLSTACLSVSLFQSFL